MAISYTAGDSKPTSTDFTVPNGDYKIRLIEAKEDTSKKGNEMIVVKYRIIMPNGEDGPSFFDRLVFTPAALWKIDHFLKSAGQHPGEGVQVDLDTDAMIGWELEAKLVAETFDGKKNMKVEAYLFDQEEF